MKSKAYRIEEMSSVFMIVGQHVSIQLQLTEKTSNSQVAQIMLPHSPYPHVCQSRSLLAYLRVTTDKHVAFSRERSFRRLCGFGSIG